METRIIKTTIDWIPWLMHGLVDWLCTISPHKSHKLSAWLCRVLTIGWDRPAGVIHWWFDGLMPWPLMGWLVALTDALIVIVIEVPRSFVGENTRTHHFGSVQCYHLLHFITVSIVQTVYKYIYNTFTWMSHDVILCCLLILIRSFFFF